MKTSNLYALMTAAVFGVFSIGTALPAFAGTASVALQSSSVSMTQSSDTAWTLEKSGSTGVSSVTWTVTATEGATVGGRLVVNGVLNTTISNENEDRFIVVKGQRT